MKTLVALAVLLCVVCMDNSCVKVAAKSVLPAKFNARNEEDMRFILETYNKEGSLLCNKLSNANWDVQTHVDTAEEYSPIQVRIFKRKYIIIA